MKMNVALRQQRRPVITAVACVVAGAVGLPSSAPAAVVPRLSEPELVALADAVVLAAVVETHTVEDLDGRVFTQATLQIYRSLTGAYPGDVMTVQVPGGQRAGGVFVHAVGAPRLVAGEVVVAFLERRGRIRHLVGQSYGVFYVRQDAQGVSYVHRELDGLSTVGRAGRPVRALREQPELLASFLARLEGAALGLSTRTTRATQGAIECAEATYFPQGYRWTIVPGQPLSYAIESGSDDILADNEVQAIARAFGTWQSPACSGGTPNLAFAETSPLGGADCLIKWHETDSAWPYDSFTLAMTTTEYTTDSGAARRSFIEFNGWSNLWRARADGGSVAGCDPNAATGGDRCFDVEAVALHEIGHVLGLGHVLCGGAVMFPEGSPEGQPTSLAVHELVGICNMYRPRSSTSERDMGEYCGGDADCASPLRCIKSEYEAHGWCSWSCDTTEACPDAYVCADLDYAPGFKFCRPGPHNAGTGSLVDPETGDPVDLCAPCTTGADCSSGLCEADQGGRGLCTRACQDNTHCPSYMRCVPSANHAGTNVCWPDGDECSEGPVDTRPGLNEPCYDSSEGTLHVCAPGLICFGFKIGCGGEQVGSCVIYCDAAHPCPDASHTCCYGVDEMGNCQRDPTDLAPHGGCFDLRSEGESCVMAEASVCEAGSACFYFSDRSTPDERKCYGLCGTQACREDQICVAFAATNCQGEQYKVCCAAEAWESQSSCYPTVVPERWDVGVACRDATDCNSELCLKVDGMAACSRECNPVTQSGCPGEDDDVNGDGVADGGFYCRLIQDQGYCWPRVRPALPPGWSEEPEEPGPPVANGGCCAAQGKPPGGADLALQLLVWLPMVVVHQRRRRSGVMVQPS